MANLEKTVEIIFGGRDEVSKTIKNIGKGLGDLEQIAMSVAQPLAGVADMVLKADAALGAMAVGGMALAIRESSKFNEGFSEISTLVDDSTDDIDAFRSNLVNYAKDSRKSIDDILKSTYTAKSAGVELKFILDALSESEKLSIAGRAELSDTTLLLASTLNAYGEGADQASKYSDYLFKTVKLGQTTIPELASSLAQVTGIAASAGVGFDQLTAAVATLTAKGLPTSQAITGIKSAISNILKPTSDARDIAASLGIQFDATALKTKGFDGILRDVYQATGGNVEVMSKLFGSVEGLNAILGLTSDTGAKFNNNLKEIQSSAGATEKAFQTMADNIGFINQQLANNVKLILIEVGDRLEKDYAGIADGVIEVFQAIGQAVDQGAFDDLFKAVDGFAKEIESFLKGLAKALPEALDVVDWSGILDALGDLGDSISTLWDGLDLTKPQDLAEVIQTVVDSIESIIRITGGMVDAFVPMIRVIGEAILEFKNLDDEQQKTIGNILAGAKAVVTLGVNITAAIGAIAASGIEMGRIFDIVIGSVSWLWNNLTIGITTAYGLIVAAIEKIIGVLGSAASYIPGMKEWSDSLKETAERIGKYREELEQTVMKDIGEMAKAGQQVWDGITGKTQAGTTAVKAYGEALANVKEIGGQVEATLDIALSKERTVSVGVDVDEASIEETKKKLMEAALKENIKEVMIETIKAQTEIQKARIQGETEVAKAAFGTIEEGLLSTERVVTDVSKTLAGEGKNAPSQIRAALLFSLYEENKRRTEQIEMEKRLTDAQAAVLEAKAMAIERGDSILTVYADGLKPHLEMILWEILEQIQIRANEEAAEFLLGL